jgi:hypothetical protein
MKKEFEGLGVPDLRELNLCLLGFWIRRYSQDNENFWKMLVDFKYNSKNLNLFTYREMVCQISERDMGSQSG